MKKIIPIILLSFILMSCGQTDAEAAAHSLMKDVRVGNIEKIITNPSAFEPIQDLFDKYSIDIILKTTNKKIRYEVIRSDEDSVTLSITYPDITDMCVDVYAAYSKRLFSGDLANMEGAAAERQDKIIQEEADYWLKNNELEMITEELTFNYEMHDGEYKLVCKDFDSLMNIAFCNMGNFSDTN